MSLVQKWLDIRNAIVVALFLQMSVGGCSCCTDPALPFTPCEALPTFLVSALKAAAIPVVPVQLSSHRFISMLWYSTRSSYRFQQWRSVAHPPCGGCRRSHVDRCQVFSPSFCGCVNWTRTRLFFTVWTVIYSKSKWQSTKYLLTHSYSINLNTEFLIFISYNHNRQNE